MTPQSYSEPVAVSGVVRGTLTAYCNGFTYKSGIVITPTYRDSVSSGSPFRILSGTLSFVRPMPIRLPNFCPEQPKRTATNQP